MEKFPKLNSVEFLIGRQVSVDHPITCANPEKYFTIKEAMIESNHLYIRGENTVWFGGEMIKELI